MRPLAVTTAMRARSLALKHTHTQSPLAIITKMLQKPEGGKEPLVNSVTTEEPLQPEGE